MAVIISPDSLFYLKAVTEQPTPSHFTQQPTHSPTSVSLSKYVRVLVWGNIKFWVWRYVVISISWQCRLQKNTIYDWPWFLFTAKDQQNKARNSWSTDQRNKVGADGPLRLSDIKVRK
ncbi:hypothetical protein EPI10_008235 [Gossypium australe]|uniref:Uncharacterized protein n=1 Tax=Gossypium australe TaxID=47621 RepID=A0A5B6V449_9ROSI|nr:hypothetical protein EPI10_008235 [Gossypium australe]